MNLYTSDAGLIMSSSMSPEYITPQGSQKPGGVGYMEMVVGPASGRSNVATGGEDHGGWVVVGRLRDDQSGYWFLCGWIAVDKLEEIGVGWGQTRTLVPCMYNGEAVDCL